MENLKHPDVFKFKNRHAVYGALQSESPVHWNSSLKGWVVTKYSDIRDVLSSEKFSVGKLQPFLDQASGPDKDKIATLVQIMRHWAPFLDPPEHGRIRMALQRGFMPRRIAELDSMIRSTVDGLLDAVIDNEEMEFISEFAFPLPTLVLAQMFGVPDKDIHRVKTWSGDIGQFVLGDTANGDKYRDACQSMVDMHEYFTFLVEHHIDKPQINLTSSLIESMSDPDGLTKEEIVSSLVLIMFAGHETTTKALGNCLLNFVRNEEQFRLLKENPELIPKSVEEFLRFDGSVPIMVRTVKESVQIRDELLKAGDRVFLVLSAGNRDPDHFDQPDKLDVTRERVPHIEFGYGIHTCLGAALARLEMKIALERILDRFTSFELIVPEENLEWHTEIMSHGVKSLNVRFKRK